MHGFLRSCLVILPLLVGALTGGPAPLRAQGNAACERCHAEEGLSTVSHGIELDLCVTS